MAHIRKLGNGQYQLRWRDPSNREKSKMFSRKADAEKQLIAIQHNILSGTYVDPQAGRTTVGELAEEWINGKLGLKPTTRALYESVLHNHIQPRWGRLPLSRVEHRAIQTWVVELVDSGLSAGHVRKIVGVLSSILGLAVRHRRLPINPAADIELPRVRERRRKYLTPEQVADLADAAAKLPADRPNRGTDAAFGQYRLVIFTLAYCGLRWSELAGLRVHRVNLTRRRLEITEVVTEVNGTLVWGTPKTHESRSVPIPRFLADELAVHLTGKSVEDLVFTSPDGDVLRNGNARRAFFNRTATAIGQPGFTPHELRHTAASLAVSSGANVKAIQRMLGHASAAMTLDRYADLFDDDLDAVADHLDAVARTSFKNLAEFSRNPAE